MSELASQLEQLRADGPVLAAAAARSGLDTPVPATDWVLRDLVTHVGGVHRWARAVVTDADADSVAATVGTGPPDGELIEWFTAGHTALVDALDAAPDDLDCFTFMPAASPRSFWIRRQAHETAVHRADAEAAGGGVTAFDPAFAQDGIAEMLLGFGRRTRDAFRTACSLGVIPDDGGPGWRVDFGDQRATVRDAQPGEAFDAGVSGTSSDLYLWLWNRPASVQIVGDPAVAALWREVAVRWG